MYCLVSHLKDSIPTNLTQWLEYHIRRGITHVFFLSELETNNEEKLTKLIKEKEFENIFLVHMENTTIKEAYNTIYKQYSKDISWILYLDISEYLMLVYWTNIPDMVHDKAFKNIKQIYLPVKDKEYLRNITKGQCRTKILDINCMLGVRRSCFPNGQQKTLRSFDVEKLPLTFDKVYVEHKFLNFEDIFEELLQRDFSTEDSLRQELPEDFPEELTKQLLEKNGLKLFENSPIESSETEHETKITEHIGEELQSDSETFIVIDELGDAIKKQLNEEFPNKTFLEENEEKIEFVICSELAEKFTEDSVKRKLHKILTEERKEDDIEYEQTKIYPELIKKALDEKVGEGWKNKSPSKIMALIKRAAKVLGLIIKNFDKVFNLVMLLANPSEKVIPQNETQNAETEIVLEETKSNVGMSTDEISVSTYFPSKEILKVQQETHEEEEEERIERKAFTDVDTAIIHEYLCQNHSNEVSVKNVQKFAMDTFGVYIDGKTIKAALDAKPANIFDVISDDDIIVFN